MNGQMDLFGEDQGRRLGLVDGDGSDVWHLWAERLLDLRAATETELERRRAERLAELGRCSRRPAGVR